MTIRTLSLLACGVVSLAPAVARADDDTSDAYTPPPYTPAPYQPSVYAPDPTSYAWEDGTLSTGIGVSTLIGGGVSGFTSQAMRDTVSSTVSGAWTGRVTIGSHIPIGLDINYLGTAATINSLVSNNSSTLIGTTVEAAVRWNILPHAAVTPYIFGGVGWQRYDVTGSSITFADSGINSSTNSLEIPAGAGFSFRDPSGLVFDIRGTYRDVQSPGLVLSGPQSSTYLPLHTWEADAAIGYEF